MIASFENFILGRWYSWVAFSGRIERVPGGDLPSKMCGEGSGEKFGDCNEIVLALYGVGRPGNL